MRATRAIAGAFGAGFTLAIASSVVLLVVSSVIAFNGWPDDLSGSSDPEVASLTESAGPIGAPARTEPVAFDLPTASASSPRRRTRESSAADRDTAASGNGTTGSQTTDTAPAGQGTAAETTAQADAEDPAPRRSSPAQPVTDAVRDTTSAVGNAVAPVTPVAGGALESVGAAGADTVDQVAQIADGPVQQLLP